MASHHPLSRCGRLATLLPILALLGCMQTHRVASTEPPTQVVTATVPSTSADTMTTPTRTAIPVAAPIHASPTVEPLIAIDVTKALRSRCAEGDWVPNEGCRKEPSPTLQAIVNGYQSFNHMESLCDNLTGGAYGVDLTSPSGTYRAPGADGGTYDLVSMVVNTTSLTCTYRTAITNTPDSRANQLQYDIAAHATQVASGKPVPTIPVHGLDCTDLQTPASLCPGREAGSG